MIRFIGSSQCVTMQVDPLFCGWTCKTVPFPSLGVKSYRKSIFLVNGPAQTGGLLESLLQGTNLLLVPFFFFFPMAMHLSYKPNKSFVVVIRYCSQMIKIRDRLSAQNEHG